jgi:hypothetical protein
MAWSDIVDPRDDLFHSNDGDPYWNEACFTSFRIPERKLMCLFYFYFRPNQKTVMAGPIIWDGTGDQISNCLYYAWDWHLPMPEGAQMFDFELVNGLKVEPIELQKSYRFTYSGPGCELDVSFQATCDPHYMLLLNGDVDPGMSDYVTRTAGHPTGHYEHFGLMNGTMDIRGEKIEVVNAATLRDHTWGPRPVRSNIDRQRGSYSYAQAPDGSGFNTFTAIRDTGPEPDPLIGTTDPITSGFYLKDGKMGHIERGQRVCTARGHDGRPLAETIEAVDHFGRELHAEGTVRNWLCWPGLFGDVMAFWCMQTFNFDGHVDAPGEIQDFMPYRQYRRFHTEGLGTRQVLRNVAG